MSKTLNYYNDNSEKYKNQTINILPKNAWNIFESFLKNDDHILDGGCGSGRDSKHFLDAGYKVTSMDGSSGMVEQAELTTGQNVIHRLFQDIDEENTYDAIWCYASLLHIKKSEYEIVFNKLKNALKQGGILFMCFKHGDYDAIDVHDRYYYDLNDERFEKLNFENKGWEIKKVWIEPCPWITKPKRPDWYSVILRKI